MGRSWLLIRGKQRDYGVEKRCWVHLLRDLKKLVEKHPKDESVEKWADEVKLIYELASDIGGGQ